MSVLNFRAKNRISDLPVFNIEQNLARKLDPTLKTKQIEGSNVSHSFFTSKGQNVHAVFERDPEILHTHFQCPPLGLTSRGGFFFSYFSPKVLGAKLVHTFRKIVTDEKSGEKKNKKKYRARSSQGCIEDVCNMFRSESKNRRGHSPGNKLGGFDVKPTCTCLTKQSHGGLARY